LYTVEVVTLPDSQRGEERSHLDATVPPRFAANAVRLQLHALAYNLGNLLLTLALPDESGSGSLTTLRERLVEIGVQDRPTVRSITFHMAEG
jgi:hypothetical protein